MWFKRKQKSIRRKLETLIIITTRNMAYNKDKQNIEIRQYITTYIKIMARGQEVCGEYLVAKSLNYCNI